ncbi:ATP-binding protein [Candidatus Woesearchaeota archaeon]|nr:ATP-binding protein [Candidatus Woesearchaeota archaeon]
MKGQVISGKFGEIIARQKTEKEIELGEILVAKAGNSKILLQAYDLQYGSQISQQNLELISGMVLEEDSELEFMEPHLRNYTIAMLKNILTISEKSAKTSKNLPSFFSEVREVTKEDLSFLTTPKNPLFVGNLRSGSKELDVPIFLPGDDVFSHHILIPATTGRGKSNLTSCMLWDSVDKDYCGILVLDPHDEYFGRNKIGLKDHPKKENVIYYTPKNAPPGTRTLSINLDAIKPWHFNGVVEWTTPQIEALSAYFKKYGKKWIEAVILEKPANHFHEGTIGVLKRRLLNILDLSFSENELSSHGVFKLNSGQTTINDICDLLEDSKKVIVDTSNFSGQVEILIGSLIASEIFSRYKSYKIKGELGKKPVISVILEEAPRVLGKEALEKGPNIFSSIAREGRKFRVGLTAITQLPSLIPRQILANMNTKIILGIEMAPERQAVIESASQDLSSDARAIASLDRGEAIITSNFARFAIPIKIPLFEDLVKKAKTTKTKEEKINFEGVRN